MRCFAGIQGGQVVAADLGRIERLARRGVRMLGLAHVMDTPLAGSSTGRGAGGLTGLGREAIAEAERVGVLVDMAHASVPAIEDALTVATRPIVISHTGFTALAGGRSRWRRYSPATRNLPDGLVREAGAQGALIGLTLATDLIGGTSMASVVRSIVHAVGLVGPAQVAIGSDFDGALRMPFDVRGLPALTAALLEAGLDARRRGRDHGRECHAGSACRREDERLACVHWRRRLNGSGGADRGTPRRWNV